MASARAVALMRLAVAGWRTDVAQCRRFEWITLRASLQVKGLQTLWGETMRQAHSVNRWCGLSRGHKA